MSADALNALNRDKAASIMSYLDDVDRSFDLRPPSPTHSVASSAGRSLRRSYPQSDAGLSTISTSRQNVFHGIKSKIDALRVENAELKQSCDRLKHRCASLDDELSEQAKAKRAEAQELLDAQRVGLQKTIDMHVAEIKSLVDDKTKLARAVAQLTAAVDGADAKHQAAVAKLQAAHATALSELKGRLSTQEKTKREQWSAKEAKRIKEATLKAMEPDIALLMNRHKAEKRRMEEDHRDELRRKDDHILQKERELAETKVVLGKQMEELLLRERSALRSHVMDESRRMHSDFEADRDTERRRHESVLGAAEQRAIAASQRVTELQALLVEERDAAEAHVSALQRDHEAALQQLRLQHQHQEAALTERHAAELSSATGGATERLRAAVLQEVKQQMAAEKEAAIMETVGKLEAEQLALTREHRAVERTQRDRIASLQREVDRLRDELSTAVGNAKGHADNVRHRDETIAELRRELAEYKNRGDSMRSAANTEFEERLRALDSAWRAKVITMENDLVAAAETRRSDVGRLERAVADAKAECAAQLESMERKHALQLASLNERVLVTVARKDEQLRQLTERVSFLDGELAARDDDLQRHEALLAE